MNEQFKFPYHLLGFFKLMVDFSQLCLQLAADFFQVLASLTFNSDNQITAEHITSSNSHKILSSPVHFKNAKQSAVFLGESKIRFTFSEFLSRSSRSAMRASCLAFCFAKPLAFSSSSASC